MLAGSRLAGRLLPELLHAATHCPIEVMDLTAQSTCLFTIHQNNNVELESEGQIQQQMRAKSEHASVRLDYLVRQSGSCRPILHDLKLSVSKSHTSAI